MKVTAALVPDAPEPGQVVRRDSKDDYLVALARSTGIDATVSGDVHLTELTDLVAPVMRPADSLARVNEGRQEEAVALPLLEDNGSSP